MSRSQRVAPGQKRRRQPNDCRRGCSGFVIAVLGALVLWACVESSCCGLTHRSHSCLVVLASGLVALLSPSRATSPKVTHLPRPCCARRNLESTRLNPSCDMGWHLGVIGDERRCAALSASRTLLRRCAAAARPQPTRSRAAVCLNQWARLGLGTLIHAHKIMAPLRAL